MKNEDREAFDKWHYENISNPPTINDLITKAWSDACLHKQKEIDELYKHLKDENDLYKNDLKFYEAENEKLKDVLVEISQETRVIEGVECSTNGAMIAAEALKELGEK